MADTEREIKATLRQILRYIGADTDYAEDAQLITYVEWLIARVREGG